MTTEARPKMIDELTELTSFTDADRFVVDDDSAAETKFMTGANVRKGMVRGPYADDATANTAGVLVGQLYYTSAGAVKVRLT